MSIQSTLEEIRQNYLKATEWVDDKDGNSEFDVTAYNEDKIAGQMHYDWNGRVVAIQLEYTPANSEVQL